MSGTAIAINDDVAVFTDDGKLLTIPDEPPSFGLITRDSDQSTGGIRKIKLAPADAMKLANNLQKAVYEYWNMSKERAANHIFADAGKFHNKSMQDAAEIAEVTEEDLNCGQPGIQSFRIKSPLKSFDEETQVAAECIIGVDLAGAEKETTVIAIADPPSLSSLGQAMERSWFEGHLSHTLGRIGKAAEPKSVNYFNTEAVSEECICFGPPVDGCPIHG